MIARWEYHRSRGYYPHTQKRSHLLPPSPPVRCLSVIFLMHTPTPSVPPALSTRITDKLVHPRGRALHSPGVAGQWPSRSRSLVLSAFLGSHLGILGPFWARVQPRGIWPDAGFAGFCRLCQASTEHSAQPCRRLLAHKDVLGPQPARTSRETALRVKTPLSGPLTLPWAPSTSTATTRTPLPADWGHPERKKATLDTDLTRNTRAPHFTPQHWLLCHMGLY